MEVLDHSANRVARKIPTTRCAGTSHTMLTGIISITHHTTTHTNTTPHLTSPYFTITRALHTPNTILLQLSDSNGKRVCMCWHVFDDDDQSSLGKLIDMEALIRDHPKMWRAELTELPPPEEKPKAKDVIDLNLFSNYSWWNRPSSNRETARRCKGRKWTIKIEINRKVYVRVRVRGSACECAA